MPGRDLCAERSARSAAGEERADRVVDERLGALVEAVLGDDPGGDPATGLVVGEGVVRRPHEAGQLVLVVEGDHEPGEGLLEAVDAVAEDPRPAGGGVEEPVGREAVTTHVEVVVVEHDAGRGVERTDLLVGHAAGGDLLAVDELGPVVAVEGEVGADRERAADGVAVDPTRVADEQQRGTGVGLGAVGVEPARVGALEQRLDPRAPGARHPLRPAGAGGVDQVERRDLVRVDHVGVADDPLDVEQPGPGGDPVEPAQDQQHVVVVAGVSLARVAPVDGHVLAAPLERVGERAGEVGVAPAVAARRGRRGDVDGPSQPRR